MDQGGKSVGHYFIDENPPPKGSGKKGEQHYGQRHLREAERLAQAANQLQWFHVSLIHQNPLFANCAIGEYWRIGESCRCLSLRRVSGRFLTVLLRRSLSECDHERHRRSAFGCQREDLSDQNQSPRSRRQLAVN